ncbi:O-antigen ligase family protein [Caulobacter sp. BK020]|uniref:O-antigen ligase family protein n=1 Tax=Caulobacter sp. BK020 TaxID=2512117 RepID=UPI00104CA7B7|nr:O-antigen ligase family protein [Caulobacter sp. BK020]TCS14906.1 O-antigen ligase [Caulobacter sp. BK020]
MSRLPSSWIHGPLYRLMIAAGLSLVLALAGGASRHDEVQQAVVRSAALLAIGASLWPLDFTAPRRHAGIVAAIAAAYLLLVLQLVPLPPAIWAALPGHGAYAHIAEVSGTIGWRPLSLSPDLTLNALAALLPATAMALAVLHLDFRDRARLAGAVVVMAAASGLLGLGQVATGGLRLYHETSQDSAVGLFANRNHQAALMACALPLTAALAGLSLRKGADRRLVLTLTSATMLFLLIALLATGSRMGLLLGLIGLVGAAWTWRAAGQRLWPVRRAARLGVGGALVVILGGLAAIIARGGAVGRLAPADIAGETRVALLEPLLTTAKAFMPLGAGFGTFDGVYRQFEPYALLSTIYMNQAHNEPLQLAIEGGIPALTLLATFLFWWGRAVWMATRPEVEAQPGRGGRRRGMAVAAATATVILMASSLVDYPLRTPLLGALFALACVELAAAAARARRLAKAARP